MTLSNKIIYGTTASVWLFLLIRYFKGDVSDCKKYGYESGVMDSDDSVMHCDDSDCDCKNYGYDSDMDCEDNEEDNEEDSNKEPVNEPEPQVVPQVEPEPKITHCRGRGGLMSLVAYGTPCFNE
jgi:hypothetical protein